MTIKSNLTAPNMTKNRHNNEYESKGDDGNGRYKD